MCYNFFIQLYFSYLHLLSLSLSLLLYFTLLQITFAAHPSPSTSNDSLFLHLKGPFSWRSGKVGEWKISGRMEKWEDRKDFVFSHVCLVGEVEKWEGRKIFCLVGEKKWRMENVVYINWLLCPCYIIVGKWEG